MMQRSLLRRLRELRSEISRCGDLRGERDGLIQKAADSGRSEREIARAAGVSPTRVHQIKRRLAA